MENCLKLFREFIFDSEQRDFLTEKFVNVLNTDLPKTQLKKLSEEQVREIAEKTLQSLTVVMEFMDKGVKGLLSGDLTIYMLQSIESTFEKHHGKLVLESNELEQLFQKKQEADKLYRLMLEYDNPIGKELIFEGAAPHEVSLNFNLANTGIDVPTYSNDVNSSDFKQSQDQFNNAKEKHERVLIDLKKEVEKQKEKVNTVINNIYNELVDSAFGLDKYRIPYYGIQNPDKENPINLFQRQLKIEELSFEMSHAQYKNTLESLIKIGKADQLAASHRIVLHWLKAIESAVQEQQRIFLRKSNLENKKGKPSYYILQLPSDKIASI